MTSRPTYSERPAALRGDVDENHGRTLWCPGCGECRTADERRSCLNDPGDTGRLARVPGVLRATRAEGRGAWAPVARYRGSQAYGRRSCGDRWCRCDRLLPVEPRRERRPDPGPARYEGGPGLVLLPEGGRQPDRRRKGPQGTGRQDARLS